MIEVNKMILPIGSRRTGKKIVLTGITIHSTGNPSSTAKNERSWLDNPDNPRKEVAWTYCIDEKQCIQAANDDDLVWHAQGGSCHTMGIEICEGGNRQNTLNRAAKFVAQKLNEYNWTLLNLYTHSYWHPQKTCPAILAYNNWQGLKEFKIMVQKELDILNQVNVNPIEPWKITSLDSLRSKGISFDYASWKAKLNDDMPVWAVFTMVDKVIAKQLGKKYRTCKNPSDNPKYNVIHNIAENGIDINVASWKKEINNTMPVWGIFTILDMYQRMTIPNAYVTPSSISTNWKLNALLNTRCNGLKFDFELWKKEINNPVPVWAVFSLLDRI